MKVKILSAVIVIAMLLASCSGSEEASTDELMDEMTESVEESGDESQEASDESDNSDESGDVSDESGDVSSGGDESSNPEEIPAPKNLNLLTGLADLSEGAIGKRPVAIMVNNIPAAMPQYGIDKADVVFEIPVEGYQTRLMCIFADYTKLPQVCSVRSCRKYFPAIALGFDAIYVNCGQNEVIDDYVESIGVVQYDGAHDKNGLFIRDQERLDAGYSREHTLYFDAPRFPEILEKDGVNMNLAEDKTGTAFKFAAVGETVIPTGKECTSLHIDFGSCEAGFNYNAETKTYFKTYYDKYTKEMKPQCDGRSGKQLEFSNLILLHNDVAFDDSAVYDTVRNYKHRLIDWKGGKGSTAYYISNGVKQPIYWIKNSETDSMRFYDLEGNELTVNRGKTYICFNEMDDCEFE